MPACTTHEAVSSLTGNDLDNTLYGYTGADTLDGGAGADTMTGYGDDDTYYVDNAGDVVIEYSNAGIDTVHINLSSYTLTKNVDVGQLDYEGDADLTGNYIDNTLLGNDYDNVLNGKHGADVMTGYGGDDTYHVDDAGDVVTELADEGMDTVYSYLSSYTLGDYIENGRIVSSTGASLTGNDLDNALTGSTGADTLIGGLGNDVLFGGASGDTLVFDAALGADNVDKVYGFVSGEDQLHLDNAIFTSLTTTGALSADQFVSGAGATAQDANDFVLYDTTTGYLYYDADGSGATEAIQFATLVGTPSITDADFMVI